MKELLVQLAVARGIKPEALKKWRQRQNVPHRHRLPLALDAAKVGKSLKESDFEFGRPTKRARAQ